MTSVSLLNTVVSITGTSVLDFALTAPMGVSYARVSAQTDISNLYHYGFAQIFRVGTETLIIVNSYRLNTQPTQNFRTSAGAWLGWT